MRLAVIVNPISGRAGRREGEGARRLEFARRWAKANGVQAEVVLTAGPGHGAELARRSAGAACDAVIAWGGDGTINEVAGPLIGTNTALGIIPSGSGDGLARSLGLPLDAGRAFDAALTKPARAIDVGYLGDRHFLNVAGVGFDAEVARAFNLRGKRGALGYLTQALRTVWTYRAKRYRVQLEADGFEGERLLVAFANGREYGNRLVLSAAADASDGWLETVVVDAGSPLQQVWRMRRLAFGLHRPASGIHRSRARTASVSGDALVCHVDGETFDAAGTVTITIRDQALLINGIEDCRSRH